MTEQRVYLDGTVTIRDYEGSVIEEFEFEEAGGGFTLSLDGLICDEVEVEFTNATIRTGQ